MKREFWVHLFVGAFLATGCLPGDTRPEPGRVYLTAEPSEASAGGFTTDDGWTIQFERILTGLGHLSLRGDTCDVYADTEYDRLFDFAVPGAQKLGEVYGLGPCDLRFEWESPRGTGTYFQNGVSADDSVYMFDSALAVHMYVRGTAHRGNETKRFAWQFWDGIPLGDCRPDPDAEPTTSFSLKSGDDLQPKIVYLAENLFFPMHKGALTHEFDLFAAADVNGDGDISRKELMNKVVVYTSGTKSGDWVLWQAMSSRLPEVVAIDGAPCRRLNYELPSEDSPFF